MNRFILTLTTVFLFSCTSCSNKNQHTDKSLSKSTPPILYARYANLPTLQRNNSENCTRALGYQKPDTYGLNEFTDLCGPTPENSSLPSGKPWQVPKAVKNFIWEHQHTPSARFQLELTDDEGIPWPSKSEIIKKQTRLITSLTSTKKLAENQLFFLVGTEFSNEGKKLSTWITPLKIVKN